MPLRPRAAQMGTQDAWQSGRVRRGAARRRCRGARKLSGAGRRLPVPEHAATTGSMTSQLTPSSSAMPPAPRNTAVCVCVCPVLPAPSTSLTWKL